MSDYESFVRGKRIVVAPAGIPDPPALSPKLFPFQTDIVRWALRRGRAAIWADCGLGKGWMALEWARVVSEHQDRPVLITAPLAVSQQFASEAGRLGIDVTVCREADDVTSGVNVTNYERLHRFDASVFGGVVLDESSILKDFTSSTRGQLVTDFAATPFRLACSATPAPNDHTELGNHAEFLGVMSRMDMLATFFCHDGGETQNWRLKGHARAEFWRWLCSWACTVKRPSDLGYDNAEFTLPELRIVEHVVPVGGDFAKEAGMLFITDASGIQAQRGARRSSLQSRVDACAALVNASREPWICWCDLNDESDALAKAIPDAVEVRGSQDATLKESLIGDFVNGRARVLVTKPSIAGLGLNLQHCADVAFVGLSNSFEAFYQAVRRTWRFGQTRPVNCHLIVSDADGAVRLNLQRKQADAEQMAEEMLVGMGDIQRATIRALERETLTYAPGLPMRLPAWLHTEAP